MSTIVKIKITDIPELRAELDDVYETKTQCALAQWGLKLAEHILELVDYCYEDDPIIQHGFAINRQWQAGTARMHDVRQAGFQVHQLAKASRDPVTQAALRVTGQAIGIGHMREHAMVASDYAVKTVNLKYPGDMNAVQAERQWQIKLMTMGGLSMNKIVKIRNEIETDYQRVEEMTRKSFWNLYLPGCVEHYLVHIMRSHQDFLPELDFVIEVDDQLVGNIMYTKAKLIDESGEEKEILTFGPVCIMPEYQRLGYGKMLIEHSFGQAAALGYDVIVIFGNPGNYVGRGFKSCKKFNICLDNGSFPSAMLVKELKPGTLDGRQWTYYDSPVMRIDEQEAERFDASLEKMEKKVQPSQEEFYIHSHSVVQ